MPAEQTGGPSAKDIANFHAERRDLGTSQRHLSGAHYERHETLDPSFYVRPRSFFTVGRVFALMFSETAGSNAIDWSSTITEVRYAGNYVYTQIRRFVVVRTMREFCFACPIFTYSNRGTSKPGVRPQEHGVIYSWGHQPKLLPGETGIHKPSIAVVMTDNGASIHYASRIYYGIHHPVQYNVKVKDIGYVPSDHIANLIGSWREENGRTMQDADFTLGFTPADVVETYDRGYTDSEAAQTTANNGQHDSYTREVLENVSSTKNTDPGTFSIATVSQPAPGYELASNPKAFFKKGRVFMALWPEPKGVSQTEKGPNEALEQIFIEAARFVVVKPKSTHCICVRISTYSGQATTKPGVAASEHAAVLPLGASFQPHPKGEPQMTKDPIYVKLEDPEATMNPMSRICFSKIYTIEANIKIRNVGRVYGESVARVDQYFAESLGLIRPSSQQPTKNTQTDSLMVPPASWYLRQQHNFIAGTPDDGWYERFDPSYCMRTVHDVRDFFAVGRVFAMLYHVPAAGSQVGRALADDEPDVQRSEDTYIYLCRFVVISAGQDCVRVCPISTYRGLGVLKPDCNASEHAPIHLQGGDPNILPGEPEKGMTKEPIEVCPSEVHAQLDGPSRIRYKKVYLVECNSKVRDIGMVRDKLVLLKHCLEESII